jgi:hypothetical protein
MASYYVWSGATGSANGTTWANAYTTLATAFSGKVAGDTFYVAHDHAETAGATISLTTQGTVANPSKVICVNRAGSVPPVSADRRATATVSTTGSFPINFVGSTHYDGIIFNGGDAANVGQLIIPNTGQPFIRLDNCSLRLRGSAPTSKIILGSQGTASGACVELNNTTVSFADVLHALDVACLFRWRNTPAAVLGTVPTFLFNATTASRGGATECIGVDLSALGSGKTIVNVATANLGANQYKFIDCKLDPAVTKMGALPSPGSFEIDFIRSGATGVNYSVYRDRISGRLTEETTIVRTGGATG